MIHLDQLIATLMQVVIESAGAETGVLVLLEENQLTVVAQCSGSRQCDLEKLAVAYCATIPVSVIHAVERTQETLVLDDAVSESSFSTDPYIQHQQTRSLLCLPILNQSQLIGILYLENNLSTGVFTRDRLQVLKLLMAQTAISLENAQSHERLADYAETLERKVEAQTQALQQEIAERQQTEAALRQSEANYRNLLQTANSIIIRYDTQGRIHYINDYGVKLLGYEEHEIVGRTLFETIIPDIEISGRDVKPFVRDLLRNPQSYPRGEGENLCRDGRRVWVVWSNQAIFNEQGEVVEILSVGNDTTQRRQAEEALQRSEAKFRAIFENSQVGIYRTRLSDGLILDANQRYANLLGFDSPEEIIGLEHTTGYYVNPSERQQFLELLKRNGEMRSYEVQMRKRDGTLFWGLCSSYLNADDDYIEGVMADISDHKQAEAALQTSEERLRLALTASNQGLYDLDLKTEERIVNPEYALMLGYNPATFHETISEWIARLHPDDRESVVATYRAYIAEEIPNFQVEYRQRTQDGQWKWTLSVGKVVAWNEAGEPIRALGVVTDIDDRKQAEAALQASEAELRALFSAIPDPLCVFNAKGQVIDAIPGNPSYKQSHREECIGKTLHQLYAQEQADEFLNYIQQVVRTQQVLTVEYSEWIAGREAWFSARIAPINHEQVIWLARDITLQKQAEAALQASEAELRALFSAIPDPLSVVTAEGRVIETVVGNPRQLYSSVEEKVGKTLHQIFEEEQADKFMGYIQQVQRIQQVLTVEYSLQIDGRETWFSARIAPIQHERVIWLSRDITLQKQAEAASILEERNHMAREIHDTLAQAFTGIIIHTRSASDEVTADPEKAQTLLTQILDLARSGLAEARRSVEALRRPYLLENGNLQDALRRLAAQLDSSISTQVVYEVIGTPYPLSCDLENNLFRIGQEALTNAIKHAKADEIRLELIYEPTQCSLRIQDDGQGFEVENQAMRNGFGLIGMAERAERIRAELKIQSHLGQGTEIVISIDRE
jgi:PAS domain S-box-containing protein